MATNKQLLEEAQRRNLEGLNSRSSKDELEAALEADGLDLSTFEPADDGNSGKDPKDGPTGDEAADPGGALQEQFDAEAEQGFRGTKVDPTPNSAYTVAGVTSGEPTPETDADLAAKVASMQRHVGGGQSAFTAEREPGEHE